MAQMAAEVANDPAAIWKFVAFILGGTVVTLSLALVKVATMLLAEKMARIADKEGIIEKLEEAREARNRRETTDRREHSGPF